MTHAELLAGDDRTGVRLERVLADPPDVVWGALTDRSQLAAWFPCDVEVDGGSFAVGAAITFRFPDDEIEMTLTGRVLTVDRPRALSFSWGDELLQFELHDHQGGCRLVLVNELSSRNAARNAAGWDVCLDRLVGEEPGPDAWRPLFERYRAAFEPVVGEQDGPPPSYKGAP